MHVLISWSPTQTLVVIRISALVLGGLNPKKIGEEIGSRIIGLSVQVIIVFLSKRRCCFISRTDWIWQQVFWGLGLICWLFWMAILKCFDIVSLLRSPDFWTINSYSRWFQLFVIQVWVNDEPNLTTAYPSWSRHSPWKTIVPFWCPAFFRDYISFIRFKIGDWNQQTLGTHISKDYTYIFRLKVNHLSIYLHMSKKAKLPLQEQMAR